VDFGLFYEICVPRPWDPGREAQVFRQVIEQVRFAEEMGFTYVWLTEHHFLEEFAHCSAPEVMLAALSQVTTTMRLGHGVVLTPPAYNHPARVAERIATLDCISGGRVNIPIHVLAGRDDRFFPIEFQRRVARERLRKEVEEIPGGHLVALSNAEGLTERLLAYEKGLTC
jgi:alkanesulfonate monooxygenase SsuD/methylene tetrahydromethanopterin reductase-like flavin-dependent oxidoreductase (luciferase family)